MKRVAPGRIEGTIDAPPSKSMMQRAVAAACLARGESEILSPSFCDDALAAMRAARALGATVRQEKERVVLEGGGAVKSGRIEIGEAGLGLRMFTPIAALFDAELELVASGSLRERPVDMVEAPLRALGARCETSNGKPPIRVHGPILGGDIEVDGSLSSQFLTGLLLALPLCERPSRLTVRALKSKPYVRMTLALLSDFGGRVKSDESLEHFEIEAGQHYRARSYRVEGDWSGAAFPLVAGAIAGLSTVKNLDARSLQADRAVLDALRAAGARVTLRTGSVAVERSDLRAFDFDASDCPDLFPPLVVLACCCEGTTRLCGASRLRHKESDRAHALATELGKIGASIRIEGDALLVAGGALSGGRASSCGDHRIAMALSVAALRSRDGVEIEGENAVSKSYPDFFEHLESLKEPLR
jgi:3-phosphoshikimate 1-carboxyvinyltransferase